jgi:tetratricopeptide (TPR) repeat protein
MRKNTNKPSMIALIALLFLTISCKKQSDFLNKKTNAALAVPATLQDFELLLANEELFNEFGTPALGTLSSDDFYVTSATWLSSGPLEQSVYIFDDDIYKTTTANSDWNGPYTQVYYCNTILDGLAKFSAAADELSRYNAIKGSALFLRAYAYYNLVQTFALPYDKTSSAVDLGIPMPMSSDLNIRYGRGNVQQVYDRIVSDINAAGILLPEKFVSPTKPSKVSCTAFLARVFLSMGRYEDAYSAAEQCLNSYDKLENYNAITPQNNSLSRTFLSEDIFHSTLNGYSIISLAQMEESLYNSYAVDDLRKTHFFRAASSGSGLFFRGTYDFRNAKYTGLATDEVLLIRSECQARMGRTVPALTDLNRLLINRYKTGKFTAITGNDADEVIKAVLSERKKELYMRGLRWTDLRRLNKEERFKTDVIHNVNGKAYSLNANDRKYAMPIPQQEIQLTGIPQNIR